MPGNPVLVPVEIDPVAIDHLTRLTREQLVSGDVAARKAYLAAIVVSEDKIPIIGSNDNIRSTSGPKGQRREFVNLFRNGAQGRVVARPQQLKQKQ
jgi:hypothetical protein